MVGHMTILILRTIVAFEATSSNERANEGFEAHWMLKYARTRAGKHQAMIRWTNVMRRRMSLCATSLLGMLQRPLGTNFEQAKVES